ncbi:hypothetical protein NQ317_019354 [Molorchus minor]|uniref:Nuclear envelope membrane protein n=1 Tax=Molorchus minor TaxID=1323400 RepID=A0ABQ9J9M2_9CUCU|nr:hypothetical protein NQ317_019354 [Molorchus minor]
MNESKIKQTLLGVPKIILCLFGLITTFYMVIDFTYFLSVPKSLSIATRAKDPWLDSSWALLNDMTLLTLFIIQHSLLASSGIKEVFNKYGLQVIYRSLYVISTSGIILFLVRNWKSTPHAILWQFNLNYRPILWLYTSIHVVAWIIIYVGNICTDVTELLGIKQVYYSIVNLPDPNYRKSHQLQRLTAHMRHPSFLAFVLIFWLCPVMSLDRLLLAIIMTSYMYLAWNTDERDYYYHKTQYERKFHELKQLHRYSY